MAQALKIKSGKPSLEQRRKSLNEKFGDAKSVINMMADYMKDGDVTSITDLIAAYLSHSPKYKNRDEFATAIGTTRQTLHRMLSHEDTVSMKVFFGAIEQIYEDANG